MDEDKLNSFIPELKIVWSALVRKDYLPNIADAIIVGGCRDLGLADKASEIYHKGICNKIITTGYQPEYLDIPEAQLLAERCVELGVPKKEITMESSSSNTGENILYASKLIKEPKSLILIHKPYMSLRFLATAEAQWPDPQPKFYATCQDIEFEEYCKIHGTEKVAYMMLGDIKRMKVYVQRGFRSEQYIPEEAYEAYEKIISSGIDVR